MILISLIGEQPIPSLLPIRDRPPEAAVLLHSDFTKKMAERLAKLLPAGCLPLLWRLPNAYEIEAIRRDLLQRIRDQGWTASELVFNPTSGTKPMFVATYLVAAELRAPFLYLQTEGKQTRLYRYEFDATDAPQVVEDRLAPGLITIDDYLRAFVGNYQITGFSKNLNAAGRQFEEAVHATLKPAVDEIIAGVRLLGDVDVDFVVRCDNQVGIVEAKTGKHAFHGIDQLNNAALSGNIHAEVPGFRSHVGSYLVKSSAVGRGPPHRGHRAAELRQPRNAVGRGRSAAETPGLQGAGERDVHAVRLCTRAGSLVRGGTDGAAWPAPTRLDRLARIS
jgi:hypothetical protein